MRALRQLRSSRARPWGRRRRRGMTLLEVVVAVSIVVVMSLVVMESMRSAVEFNELLSQRDAVTRQARVAMQKIRQDLQLAFLTPHQQAADFYRTVFVGVDANPMDTLVFASLSHQRIYRNSRESDQTEISIWGERALSDQGEGYVLYHREAPRIDHLPDEGGAVYALAYNVDQFSLRYLDAQTENWVDEWDSRQADTYYRLPRAVEVVLVLLAPDPDRPRSTIRVPFATTLTMHYGQRIPSPLNPFGSAGPLAGLGHQPIGGPRDNRSRDAGARGGGNRGGGARGGAGGRGGGARPQAMPGGGGRPGGMGGGR